MEDPIRIPMDEDVNLLSIPPMDLDFLTADFNGEIDGGDFVGGVDFDFSFDDLEFADDLLLESPQSDVLNPNFQQNLNNGGISVYDCENNGLISLEESNFGELKFSSPNSPNLGQSRSNGEIRVYDCLNQGLVSSEEMNSGGKLINSMLNFPNCDCQSPNSEQNRSNGEIKVYDCSNQDSVSSKESNFRGESNSSSLKILNCNDRSPSSEQIQSSDEIRVYDCSKPVPVSSEESNFGNKTNCHSPNSSDLGTTCDHDISSSLFVNNNNNSSEDKLSESSGLKRKIKAEETIVSKNNSLSKRKREQEQCKSASFNVVSDEDDKRKARLVRNRESAQLSRQRKKQYLEELEDKVKSMHSTITDLHSRISYVMTENATLRQQLFGGAGAGAAASVVPPPMMNGMYPMGTAPMPYPWMPCPPFMVKPQGSQVPLVPIPRLKPQQPVSSLKGNKKGESKKNERKTKKVASISLLGLLFFFLLFGGLLPLVNVRYGGSGEGFGFASKGKVLMVNNHVDRVGCKGRTGIIDEDLWHGRGLNMSDGFGPPLGNCSEPLTASLYVPRNDKLVKIDGNLIIHSVLASERAVATHTEPGVKTGEETSLAIVRQHPPYPVPRPGKNDGRRPEMNGNSNGRQRAIGSSFSDQSKPVASDGKLQQWFREGLAGPMLSSGMCTEVFQFDISPTPGSIVPATFISNATSENRQRSTHLKGKPRNRRILKGHSIPLDGKALNTTEENMPPHKQRDGLKNNTESSIVVSVLVDPREVGDGDGEGVIRSKTLSRIFVVVLIDSVKYVTYSCMLPFVGLGNHLVTT